MEDELDHTHSPTKKNVSRIVISLNEVALDIVTILVHSASLSYIKWIKQCFCATHFWLFNLGWTHFFVFD